MDNREEESSTPSLNLDERERQYFLECRDVIREQQEAGVSKKIQWRFCNASIQGGDCYGETFCEHYNCSHKLMRCSCGYLWCGCCFEEQHKYIVCLECHKEPVVDPSEQEMTKFLGIDNGNKEEGEGDPEKESLPAQDALHVATASAA